jgi:hypothetical protein
MTVYTTITGDIDPPRSDILCLGGYGKFKRDVMNSKIYKILPHLFINDDSSLYLDGNIYLKVLPEELESWLDGYDIALFKHPQRKCVYGEGLAAVGCYEDGNIQAEIFDHMDAYRDEKFPKRGGLWECGILLRKHNEAMRAFCNEWWAQICRYSNRDQISFPYVLAKFPNIRVNTIETDLRHHPFFEYKTHIKKRS